MATTKPSELTKEQKEALADCYRIILKAAQRKREAEAKTT
jgi:hypothetical protein